MESCSKKVCMECGGQVVKHEEYDKDWRALISNSNRSEKGEVDTKAELRYIIYLRWTQSPKSCTAMDGLESSGYNLHKRRPTN